MYCFVKIPAVMLMVGILLQAPLLSQTEGSDQTEVLAPLDRPVATATLRELAPVMDGEVLADPAWSNVTPVTGMTQVRPDQGQPATQHTELRIVYTADTIYFGVVCYDTEPESILVLESRRDASLDDNDSILLILDTYHDQQNGFVFGTNPAGVEYDAQVMNEGQGTGRFSVGGFTARAASGGGLNVSWDAAWEVKTQISEIGWSAEIAIPFRTLRYSDAQSQTWGFNFQRNIGRHRETSYWASLPSQFNLYRLHLAGTLTDIEIPHQRNLQLTPYVVGQVRRRGSRGEDTNWLGDGGADGKVSITSSLNLDFTYNTDFAQVEVDDQRINLDRFNLFFPEKRPFFLENAGLFAVGTPREVDVFFSRRIGISDDGQVIPILAGARLSGKVGQTEIGAMYMATEEFGGTIPTNHFTVARVRRELANRSYLGAMFVNRQGTGSLALDDDYNRSYAVDGRWGIGEYGQVFGYAAGTKTPGALEGEHAFKIATAYDSPTWLSRINYTQVAEDFNPEVGFLQRAGFRKLDLGIYRYIRPTDFIGILELRPHASYGAFWDFDGFLESARFHGDNHWEWRNGYEVHAGINLTHEGLLEDFEISQGVNVPPGTYNHVETPLVFMTNQRAWLSFRINATIGGFFGGDRVALSPAVRFRSGETFDLNLSLQRNDIDLPGGSFITNLARLRAAYYINPRVFFQSLIQYNDDADLWSMNLRFGWLQAANTGLFLVYNDTRGIEDLSGIPADRSLILKFSWLFDLLD